MSDVSEQPENGAEAAPEVAKIILPVVTAGQMLREAREAKGFSVQDVAQTLNLKPAQINAIETQDMAQLPGAVFVRGFMRNYAKAVGLDPQAVMAAFQEGGSEVLELNAPVGTGGSAHNVMAGERSGARMVWIILALLALGGVAVGVAYLKGGVVWQKVPSVTGDKKPAPTGATPIAPTLAEPVTPGPAASTSSPVSLTPTVVTHNAAPVPGPGADSVGQGTLHFAFSGEAWLEVKDASGVVVFSGKGKQGVNQEVSGKPPFALVVGNAKEVTLEYGGKRVDLAPYTRATVARMTVP